MLVQGVLPRNCPRNRISRPIARSCPELVKEAVVHEERSTHSPGRTPRIGMAEDASSGFLDVARNDRPSLLCENDRPRNTAQTDQTPLAPLTPPPPHPRIPH